MDECYVWVVRGPSSSYPRGYLWLIPVWFAAAAGAVIYAGYRISGSMPFWLGATEVAGLLLATVILLSVLATVRRNAFRADTHGIWLGVRTSRKRPKLRQVHIVWPEVAQIRMVSRHYGLLLEIALGPAARIVHRPNLARQVSLWLGMLIMPVGLGRGRPALTAARADPPRYLIKLCDVAPAELTLALAGLKPAELPVRVMAKRQALRLAPPLARQQPVPRPIISAGSFVGSSAPQSSIGGG